MVLCVRHVRCRVNCTRTAERAFEENDVMSHEVSMPGEGGGDLTL